MRDLGGLCDVRLLYVTLEYLILRYIIGRIEYVNQGFCSGIIAVGGLL